ncbi:MAG: glycosyltransferase [Patiriisocius sp.]|uniref:glycosyltransferase n=1 Tax=Patiriisocius sp. TaxID=2822396 RepID=UPI003EFAC98B
MAAGIFRVMIAIVIPCYKRLKCLQSLLSSLELANYNGSTSGADLVFSVDYSGQEDVADFVQKYQWPFGEKRVVLHEENIGLRQNVLFCGDLTADYEGVIVLEDDLTVAPGFYDYILAAAEKFAEDSTVAQLALYSYAYDELQMDRFFPLKNEADGYLLQWACSWGQYWSRQQWRRFREWYDTSSEETLQHANIPKYVKQWPESSWKKYFIAYLSDTQRYVYYPHVAFTTNMGVNGVNHSGNMVPVTQVALSYDHKPSKEFKFRGGIMPAYDCFYQPKPEYLNSLLPELESYDYVVNLSGLKPQDLDSKKYLLCRGRKQNSVMNFADNFYPLELNLIYGRDGEGIQLIRVENYSCDCSWEEESRTAYWMQRMYPSTLADLKNTLKRCLSIIIRRVKKL